MKQNFVRLIRDAFVERVPKDGVFGEPDVKKLWVRYGLTADILVQYIQQYPLLDVRLTDKCLYFTLRVIHKGHVLWIEFRVNHDKHGARFEVVNIRF